MTTTLVWSGFVLVILLLLALDLGVFNRRPHVIPMRTALAWPEGNLAYRLARRWMPVTTEFDGARFFTTRDGVRHATPLFLVLLMVESSDVMFAIDSIPAGFSLAMVAGILAVGILASVIANALEPRS